MNSTHHQISESASTHNVFEHPVAVVEIHCPPGTKSKGHNPIGVAAIISLDGINEYHWMAVDTSFDDLAKGLMVRHLRQNVIPEGEQLTVWVKGLVNTLKHIPGARCRGGNKSRKSRRFRGFEIFDSLETDERQGLWTLANFKKGEEPSAYWDVKRLAKSALKVAEANMHLADDTHWEQHGWELIASGRVDNPDSKIDVFQ